MSSNALKTPVQITASPPRSRAAVAKDLLSVEGAIAQAEQLLPKLNNQRQIALCSGDDVAVDGLDRDIADVKKVLSRNEERLVLFRQEMEQVDLAEQSQMENASRLRAEAASAAGSKRLHKINEYIGLLSAQLKFLAAESYLVEVFNQTHSDQPIPTPNSTRHEVRKVIPARSEEVKVGGQYQAHTGEHAGTIEIRGSKAQVVTREIPAEIVRGYEPEDICETVFLPEVFSGGPSWGDVGALKNSYGGRYSRPRIESIEDALAIIAIAEKKS